MFPDQPRPERDFVGFGEVRGPSDVCLDNLGPGVGHQVGVFSCHGKGQNQVSSICHFGKSSVNLEMDFGIPKCYDYSILITTNV